MSRAEEIRKLNRLPVEEFLRQAAERLALVETIDDLHQRFARSVGDVVQANNAADRPTVLILPYGPVAQYPLLRDIVNSERISLKRATFFFMDEYADSEGRAVPPSHPLSFRGSIEWLWEEIDEKLRPSPERVIFPDETNAAELAEMIRAAGGIEVCYGGVGVHGHVAFNEPEPGVRESEPRLVRLNDFTVTINAIRAGVGGDLENFARQAWTLGMRQCLGARRIELYCRNDIEGLDWANTVLRLAALGTPGDDYPVTWTREHPNCRIVTDRRTAASPRLLI